MQQVAFGMPVLDRTLYWGGPTDEVFALCQLADSAAVDRNCELPEDRGPRPFVTQHTAVFLPGRDHPPRRGDVARARFFLGSVWLDPPAIRLYLASIRQ